MGKEPFPGKPLHHSNGHPSAHQDFPILFSTVLRTFRDDEMFSSALSTVVATSHMWLLSACSVVSVVNSEEQNYST